MNWGHKEKILYQQLYWETRLFSLQRCFTTITFEAAVKILTGSEKECLGKKIIGFYID